MAIPRSARTADPLGHLSPLGGPCPTGSGTRPAMGQEVEAGTTATKRRPPWRLRPLLALAAVLAAAGAWRGWDQPTQPVLTLVVAPPPLAPARACVTRHGFCPVSAVRAGDPCRCPDTLRGGVPGHVELVRGDTGQGSGRDWPDRRGEDPRASLVPLVGP